MERLKTLTRNYLSSPPPQPPASITASPTLPPLPHSPTAESPPSSPKATSPSPSSVTMTTTGSGSTATSGEEVTELRRLNTRIQKSFNDSTRRISSLLTFRQHPNNATTPSTLTTPTTPTLPSPPESIPLEEHLKGNHNKGRFLRSKSSIYTHTKNKPQKTNSKDEEHEEEGHESEPDEHDRDMSKKKILSDDRISREFILKRLHHDLDVLIAYFQAEFNQTGSTNNFMETSDVSGHVYYQLAFLTKQLLNNCTPLVAKIESNAGEYDYNGLESNGYRSIIRVYESCLRRLLLVVHELNEKKNRRIYLKLMTTNLKDFQSWLRLLEKYELVLETCVEMQTMTSHKSPVSELKNVMTPGYKSILFVHSSQVMNTAVEQRLFKLASHIDAFFGKVCGFQFCESLQLPMLACSIALTSYNDGFEMFTSPSLPSSQQQSSATVAAPARTSPTPPFTSNSASTSGGNVSYSSSGGSSANGANEAFIVMTTPTSSANNNNNNTLLAVSPPTPTSGVLSQSAHALGKAAMSFMSSTKYIMDPDLRAKKMSHVMRRANVEFCKEFWQLTETSIVQMGSNLVNPKTAINVLKQINLSKVLRLPKVGNQNQDQTKNHHQQTINSQSEPEYVDVFPPKNTNANDVVNIRIISHQLRRGMEELDHLKTIDYTVSSHNYLQSNLAAHTSSSNGDVKEPSKCLMLHAHGGGFIAQSSRSHEIYLRPWARELHVPIVSIDYSLAPEHAFPRASEECFYVYCWCLLNKEALGWTGEKIVVVGDSAGGILVTNIVQRAIMAGIRVPDALVPIYTPFLLTYSLSPSRLLSIMDPLLNFGILWRCLAAYCGINFQSESENFRNMLNRMKEAAATTATASSTTESSSVKSASNSKPHAASSVSERRQAFKSTTTATSSSRHSSSSNKPTSVDDLEALPQPIAVYLNDEDDNLSTTSSSAPSSSSSSSSSLNNLAESERDRLVKLHEIMGESIFLIEKLRTHQLPYDPIFSPLLTDDAILAKFPRTCLIACTDPFIDDNVEMLKRLRHLNVSVDILIVDNGSPHGFLNMHSVSDDTHESFIECLDMLKELVDELKGHHLHPHRPHLKSTSSR